MKIFQRVLKTQVSSVVDTVTSFVTYCRKVFIYTRYKYMDGWERLIEIHYPQKKEFYSNLGMGNVTDTDQKHYKRDWKDFGLKNLG